MKLLLRCVPWVAVVLLGVVAAQGAADSFKDPIETPSAPTRLAVSTQLSAVTRAGSRLVAVGIRGLVIVSDDAGRSWRQAQVPVSSDLVAVRFPTPQQGWVAGHDGVILHSSDAGATWSKQLDGRMAAQLLTEHFLKLSATGDADAARLLDEVKRNYESGPEMPILDLWFEDEQRGFAVGPFGTMLGTLDGGKTWESWMEKVDNAAMLHYNAIRGVGGEIFVASEQGTVFKLERDKQRFVPMQSGYKGSFFGFVGNRDYIIAHGLRGSAYRSRDGGKSWHKLETGVQGGLNGGVMLDDGRIVIVTQDGRLIASADAGDSFKSLPVPRPGLFVDVAQANTASAVIVGMSGAQLAGIR